MEPNMKANWNNGMDYGFSMVKTLMLMLGVWPFQRNELFCTIQWLIIVITESLALVSLVMECFQSCDGPKDFLEIILLVEGTLHGWISSIFPRFYMKRIAVNINSAIEDWSTLTETKSRVIMTSYARVGRTIVSGQLVIAILSCVVFFIPLMTEEKQQVLIVDNHTIVVWSYLYPATCLFGGVSYHTYYIFMAIQALQLLLITLGECTSDSFFFCITMHLCGQLELLRNRFAEIKRETDNNKRHENILRPLIKRHHQLITLAKNIEDSFNINILMRFMLISVVIAMSGLRLITLIRQREYNEAFKMTLYIQFYVLQCLLFTHAGDILHTQSASITMAIYNATWYELPPTTVKDLMLVRMNSSLRLSAGKFFYLTRTTMTDILKTTMSYISFLQVTMED